MNIKIRNIGLLLLLGLGTISSANAHDHDFFGLSLNLGSPAYYARPEVYYDARPVYVDPPRVIYYGQPVVVIATMMHSRIIMMMTMMKNISISTNIINMMTTMTINSNILK